jgi:hypothetical protein
MSPERSKPLLLAVLLAILGVLVARSGWWSAGTGEPAPSRQSGELSSEAAALVTGLQIDRLEAAGSVGPIVRRNLFRFDEGGPTGAPRPAASPRAPATPAPGLGFPAADAPLAFALIGIVETPSGAARVAVLSDGRGVYHGTAGDIIEGQFRIVRVDTESVEMARLDDGVRRVIRLQGASARGPANQ